MKVLANDGISPSGKAALEANGHQVITDKVEQDQLIEYINTEKVDVLLVRSATKVRKDIIDACEGLKMIGRGGVGMDNIDVEYARNKGINVFNTPASSSQSVAELVFSHLFSIARGLHDSNRQMPDNGVSDFKKLKKKYAKGIELRGKTIGIIGFGRIGQYTAKYALGNGMKVIAHDPFVEQASIPVEVADQTISVEVTTISFDDLLANSDVISVHVPKQANGNAVIGKAEIEKMKDGVLLVNLSRGGVIDEEAILEAIESGKVAAASLDVFENEPTPREDLMKVEGISLSPHIGAATLEAQERIGLEIAEIVGQA